jgi:Na+/H+-dicarboxylate symporter
VENVMYVVFFRKRLNKFYLILGTASLHPKANGKIGMVSFVFIFVTNALGTGLGVVSFFVFRPGKYSSNIPFYTKHVVESNSVMSISIYCFAIDKEAYLRNFILVNQK